MLTLIEVKCPHCGARGQIMLPPLSAIIIGPCPQCEGLVVVFCGQVLPLMKDIMENGTFQAKHDHLMAVLTQFVQERVMQLLQNVAESQEAETAGGSEQELGLQKIEDGAIAPERAKDSFSQIAQAEVDQFVKVDLKFIDDKDYFEEVFG